MKILIAFNRAPYDNTDVSWNGLRLAAKLVDGGSDVRIFLMNDAVDRARDGLHHFRAQAQVPASCGVSAMASKTLA